MSTKKIIIIILIIIVSFSDFLCVHAATPYIALVVLVVQWLSIGLVIRNVTGLTPGRGAMKSTRSTQPSIPPG